MAGVTSRHACEWSRVPQHG